MYVLIAIVSSFPRTALEEIYMSMRVETRKLERRPRWEKKVDMEGKRKRRGVEKRMWSSRRGNFDFFFEPMEDHGGLRGSIFLCD